MENLPHLLHQMDGVTDFVRNHDLKSVCVSWEVRSVDVQLVCADMIKVRNALHDYDTDCIFNMDVTGLFFKFLPR